MIRGAGALALCLMVAEAGALELAFPLDCTLGETCFLQQYADRDTGEGYTDHECGPRSYDGHKGTDFMLPSLAAMRAGVEVRAAAPGRVLGLRDGMADVPLGAQGAPAINGRECGNGVVLGHEGGWQTQYCHMKQGSVAVTKGETVAAGQRLGDVGVSGKAQVPHLHLSLRDPDQRDIDPFDGLPITAPCDAPPGAPLWAEPERVVYAPGGAVSAGILPMIPRYEAVLDGAPHAPGLTPDAPAMVFWALFYGMETGDRIVLRLDGPQGRVAEDEVSFEKDRALEYRAVGRKARGPWPPGLYRGEARLIRGGDTVAAIAAETDLR